MNGSDNDKSDKEGEKDFFKCRVLLSNKKKDIF